MPTTSTAHARGWGSDVGSTVQQYSLDTWVSSSKPSTNFEFQRMTMASFSQKKRIKRVVEYGPYIPTLARLLEEGYFD